MKEIIAIHKAITAAGAYAVSLSDISRFTPRGMSYHTDLSGIDIPPNTAYYTATFEVMIPVSPSAKIHEV